MRHLLPRTIFIFAIYYVSSSSVSVSATDSLGRVNLITKLPLAASLILFPSESQSAKVWIPEAPPAKDTDGSVQDEYAEVATVFAKPEAKLVESEVLPSEQAVPWTSLKQEWELYKKFHENKNRRQSDQSSSSSEDSSDEEEEDEEQDDDEDKVADEIKLPQAFYGQQNADDDEKDFLNSQRQVYADKRSSKKKNKKKQDSDEEEDDEGDEEEEDQAPPANTPDASAIADIQGLEQLTDDEKQAIIDKIFAGAAVAPQAFTPQSPSSGESEEVQDDASPPPKKKGEDEEEDDDDDVQDDDDGGGKKDKKKKKKKKKGKKKGGGGGWGWKKPIVIPIPPPKAEKGWGWKHDGLLEQLVKGGTWERVLNYYHNQKDASEQNKGDGWGEEKPGLGETAHVTGEKLVTKLLKGSFWDRAFQTYVQYKNSKPSKPAAEYSDTPLKIDW